MKYWLYLALRMNILACTERYMGKHKFEECGESVDYSGNGKNVEVM